MKQTPEKGQAKDEAQSGQVVTEQPETKKTAVTHTDNSKNGYLAARRAARANGEKQ